MRDKGRVVTDPESPAVPSILQGFHLQPLLELSGAIPAIVRRTFLLFVCISLLV